MLSASTRCPARVVRSVFLMLALPVAACAQPQARVQVQIQHAGRTVMVELNGVPVGTYGAEHSTAAFQGTHFLRNGANRLAMRWRQESPSDLPLSVEVKSVTDGEISQVLSVEPENDSRASGSGGGWQEATYDFEVQGVPSFTWQSAKVVELTDRHRAQIREQAVSLWTAFDEGDNKAVMAELGTPLLEMAGMREDVLTRTNDMYRVMMADPDWSVRPLDAGSLRVESHGALVRVTADRHVIDAGLGRERPGARDRRVRLDSLYYAHVDGDWKLVLIGL